MRRVVITGMGIMSCLGNLPGTVSRALREGVSGIRPALEFKKHGLHSQVAGIPDGDLDAAIDRKLKRFMGDAAAYAYVAMRAAISDAGFAPEQIQHPRIGVIAGSGGGSSRWQIETADTLRERGLRKVSPWMVPRTMCSTVSAALVTAFGILGLSYSISAACATSAHCIGAAAETIIHGAQDVMFAGGGEEVHWSMAAQFDAMGALARSHNGQPTLASRPYDRDRDGFVIAGGGGMLVLEEYQHARRRGAHIYAELVGYGIASDGQSMVAPGRNGAARAMRMALARLGRPVDYLNTHGTATPLGDLAELAAVEEAFGGAPPPMSSTKALSGHSLGAAGVHESIYCLLMLEQNFIAGSRNIEHMDPEARRYPIVTRTRQARLDTVMSNSFGFGGTNASLVLARV